MFAPKPHLKKLRPWCQACIFFILPTKVLTSPAFEKIELIQIQQSSSPNFSKPKHESNSSSLQLESFCSKQSNLESLKIEVYRP